MTTEAYAASLDAAAVSAETASTMVEKLGNKVESMFDRMAIKLTIMAAITIGIKYLTDAVKDAEAANTTYTDQFKDADATLLKYKATIGDDLLPSLELLKQTMADEAGASMRANAGHSAFGIGLGKCL